MSDSLNVRFAEALVSTTGAEYRVLRPLGRGGSAETFLATATSGPYSGLLFAIKVFRRLSKPEWRRGFLKEVEFLRTCDHPAIMRVFDEGIFETEHPFVVAEYLPQSFVNVRRLRPTMVKKLVFARQLLSALNYLSQPERSVVHRDIKPQNIFIKGGSCVLGDFGLMKRHVQDPSTDRPMLKESLGWGMPRSYRTPDLVAYLNGGPPPTPKSDVFQLGLVLAELFTGKNPQRPVRGNQFTSPVKLMPLAPISAHLGARVMDYLQQMLHPEPDQRPDASAVLREWTDLFMEAAASEYALNGQVLDDVG
jgi:serine/threonine protein kinase